MWLIRAVKAHRFLWKPCVRVLWPSVLFEWALVIRAFWRAHCSKRLLHCKMYQLISYLHQRLTWCRSMEIYFTKNSTHIAHKIHRKLSGKQQPTINKLLNCILWGFCLLACFYNIFILIMDKSFARILLSEITSKPESGKNNTGRGWPQEHFSC